MKKIFFWLLLIVFVILVAEIGGYISWSILRGELVGPIQLQKIVKTQDYTQENTVTQEEIDGLDNLMPGYKTKSIFLHPYSGYSSVAAEKRTHTITNTDDELCVLIMGGSVAGQVSSYSKYMEEQLALVYPSIQTIKVNSLAIGSLKQPQQLMQLNYFLSLGQSCDIIVNLDGHNEAQKSYANVRNNISHAYPVNNHWAKIIESQSSSSQHVISYEIVLLAKKRVRLSKLLKETPLHRSSVVSLLWYVYDNKLAHKHVQLQEEIVEVETSDRRNISARGMANPKYKDDDGRTYHDDIADLWKNSSILMHQTSQQNGMKYYHFLQSSYFLDGVRPQPHPEEERVQNSRDVISNLNEVYTRFQALAPELKENGVDFVDLTSIFVDEPEQVFVDAVHVTQLGKQLYIDAIVDHISKTYTYAGSSQ